MKDKKTKQAKKPKSLKVPHTVQESIPYKKVYPDTGIIETSDGVFCRAYKFQDVNFSVAKQSDQEDIFVRYCQLLNQFDSSVNFQILILNHAVDRKDFEKNILIPLQNNGLDVLIEEENQIMLDAMIEGRNNLVTDKYLIVSIRAESAEKAAMQFARYDTDVVSAIERIGQAGCDILSATDYLELLYDIYNQGEEADFAAKTVIDDNGTQCFDFRNLKWLGLTTKDAIGPASMTFKPNYFQLGDVYGRVEYLANLPSTLNSAFYPEITSLDFELIASMQLRSMPPDKALKKIRDRLTSINGDIIAQQKKAAQGGYSGELISPTLRYSQNEVNEMLEDLQTRDQKIFNMTMTFVHFAPSIDELNRQTEQIKSTARKYLVTVNTMQYQQEAGLNTSLPLCNNQVAITRVLTTETVAIFVPFNVQDLHDTNGIYYGTNAISKNMCVYNRLHAKNPAGWLFGVPGSGKSFSAKAEMMQVLLRNQTDEVFVVDPEREFFPLVSCLNKYCGDKPIARCEHIALGSKNYINPLDLAQTDDEDIDPMATMLSYVLGLVNQMYSADYPLPSGADSLIDRAMRQIYRPYLDTLAAGRPDERLVPTLKDLQKQLMAYNEPAAREVALAMEIYTQGSLDLFAHQTVHRENEGHTRLTVFDIKDTGKSLKSIAMLVVTNFLWNRIAYNRYRGVKTWVYFDEIYLLFRDEHSAQFLNELWKRSRKYNGIITGITQNIDDLLSNPMARTLLSNSEYIYMLSQSPMDRAALAQLLQLSDSQLSYITNADKGCGLLRAEKALVPITNKFPKNTELYRVMNTNMNELSEEDLRVLNEERHSV